MTEIDNLKARIDAIVGMKITESAKKKRINKAFNEVNLKLLYMELKIQIKNSQL